MMILITVLPFIKSAAVKGHRSIISALVKVGKANVDEQEATGKTPVMLAILNKQRQALAGRQA
jgi:hypothetical protein